MPMTELTIAMMTLAGVSAVAGVVAARMDVPKGERLIVALTLWLVATLGFIWFCVGRLYWAKWVESPAVIAWSNLSPVLLAVAAGWTWRLPGRPVWRRVLFAGSLALIAGGAAFWPVLGPILRPPRPASNLWADDVALQSSWANCSPAAAATLLRRVGIDASEREMVELCLTDSAGTPTLGLYRGLALKARSAQHEVAVVTGAGEAWLERQPWPALLLVQLPEEGVRDPRYETQWGWVPGLGHSVVCFGQRPQGGWLIGDPSHGREVWTRHDLDVLWHGRALRVVP